MCQEEAYNQNGYVESSSNIVVPAGRHVVQPVIYRSTSLPNAMQTKSVFVAPWDDPNQKYDYNLLLSYFSLLIFSFDTFSEAFL